MARSADLAERLGQLVLAAREPAGKSPPPATSFLARARKEAKNTAPTALALAPSASGFPVLLRTQGRAQNSLRSLRSLRSNKLRESDHVSRLRREPLGSCAARRRRGAEPSSRTANSRTSASEPLWLARQQGQKARPDPEAPDPEAPLRVVRQEQLVAQLRQMGATPEQLEALAAELRGEKPKQFKRRFASK